MGYWEDDDICRTQPSRGGPCPRCGYVSEKAPAWADFGVTFALGASRYRIVSVGSTNKYAPRGLHFEDLIICELVTEKWSFPDVPCLVSDVQDALLAMNKLPHFRPGDLQPAYMIEVPR